jgi:ABC-2 type transport system ATP-binding protein
MMNSIEARGLVKTYKEVRALDGLDLTVPSGTVFGLLGPNGAGKSTTVKILTTLARPDTGAATVEGIDVVKYPARLRRIIGVVAQESGADPMATARENLILQGRLYKTPSPKKRADELLERFGLADAANRFVRTYSGGMRRRLDVAIGLMNQPRVLFLDEPTTGLDPEARAVMWQEIRRLKAEGITVLLTTHYLDEADHLAANVAIVDRGTIVASGTPDGLKGELKGDQIVVRLEKEAPGVQGALAGVVRDVVVAGLDVTARSDDGAAAIPSVLAALSDAGIGVASVSVARPSLDDVYLRYTGRRFEAQEVAA